MTEETRTSKLAAAVDQITRLGGLAERTRIDTNLEVIDATGGIAGAAYIIIEDQEGYNVPAVRLSGVPYTNGDLVNVLYVEGTEPVAFQQGSGSVNPEQGKVSKIWQPDFSDVVAEANNSDLDFLLHGNLDFDNDGADHSITAAGTSDLLLTTAGGTITFDDSGNLSIPGTLTIPSDLIHAGDPDTKLSFADDQGSLTVGNVLMLQATETTQNLLELGDVAGGGDVDVNLNAGQVFLQGSDGALGLGTTSPSAPLHIQTAAPTTFLVERTTNGQAIAQFQNTVQTWQFGLRGTFFSFFIFDASNSTRPFEIEEAAPNASLYVDSAGEIGLGTATPGSKLEINLATADLEIVDSGTAAATEAGWVEVQIGGATHYIRTFLAK